ncbi:hypothetical protein [Succinivibrio dextrinosolvens]|jgi:uncharacterized membrane protein|uniref:hypothetical protein n=1 Tax=Succinivibrio dextrinosolvens TaxID=83771 RepID=UPI00241F1F3E|nr:hypothetical protein [Succinivibrio dextrinosolvens]MBE6423076.1 hypothetical protein [Succinivibrio dextrinosolvens]
MEVKKVEEQKVEENKVQKSETECSLSTMEKKEFRELITEFSVRSKKNLKLKRNLNYILIPFICLMLLGTGNTVIAHTSYSGNAIDLGFCLLAIVMLVYTFVMAVRVSSVDKGRIEKVIEIMQSEKFMQLSKDDRKLLKELI